MDTSNKFSNKGNKFLNNGNKFLNKGNKFSNKGNKFSNKGNKFSNNGNKFFNKGNKQEGTSNTKQSFSIQNDFPSLDGNTFDKTDISIKVPSNDLSSNNMNANKWSNLVKKIDKSNNFNKCKMDTTNYVKQETIRKKTMKYTLDKIQNKNININVNIDYEDDCDNKYLSLSSDNESLYSDYCSNDSEDSE